ncbi:hypothetical protein FEM48_Zijuj05G0082100 [Ziziphus jujuba var. spinosa]|uniref:Uncharacterized protein n=1 Tax=Ziziphus jujuba var. spinosa TaxID=714518 RepID=A0A978VDU3_ZIZJJ|nr:hypothetical protein FEM48_Zijuj05G0082100 [Ziziphus jujuba var. spinosa]
MVAISLYRGNLHRVPDVPRRWLMPNPQISLKDFRVLLTRRSRALSRIRSSSSSAAPSTATITTTISNPNPNPNPIDTNSVPNQLSEAPKEESNASRPEAPLGDEKLIADCGEGPSVENKDRNGVVEFDGFPTEPVNGSVSLPDPKPDVAERASDPVEGGSNSRGVPVEKVDELPNSKLETKKKDDAMNDKLKRKVEVEEKLEILNGKKHNLVQLLKQILNAEEELKRRICMQGNAIRPSVPLQVDASNDSGSMTRHFTPRMGSETNLNGDLEGQMFRMNSTSPSSESPIRRPAYIQHNVVPHPSRATFGATGSPSRFAPIGHQGHPANLPTLSVSGTNYIASSPSPAASGGTSTFRDSRLPSPWN